jgi:hypothetical protein
MNSYIRIVATHCSIGTWFVSGNTLHKGDTEDDDDDNKYNNNKYNNNYNNSIGIHSRAGSTAQVPFVKPAR